MVRTHFTSGSIRVESVIDEYILSLLTCSFISILSRMFLSSFFFDTLATFASTLYSVIHLMIMCFAFSSTEFVSVMQSPSFSCLIRAYFGT
jgi:hypothetical protein